MTHLGVEATEHARRARRVGVAHGRDGQVLRGGVQPLGEGRGCVVKAMHSKITMVILLNSIAKSIEYFLFCVCGTLEIYLKNRQYPPDVRPFNPLG